MVEYKKTRIHHQRLCLGEELPGLHCKDMKKNGFDKAFFEKAFSKARMQPYSDPNCHHFFNSIKSKNINLVLSGKSSFRLFASCSSVEYK